MRSRSRGATQVLACSEAFNATSAGFGVADAPAPPLARVQTDPTWSAHRCDCAMHPLQGLQRHSRGGWRRRCARTVSSACPYRPNSEPPSPRLRRASPPHGTSAGPSTIRNPMLALLVSGQTNSRADDRHRHSPALPIQLPPRRTRPSPLVTNGSMTAPAAYGAYASRHHSSTLPCMSCRPHAFAG